MLAPSTFAEKVRAHRTRLGWTLNAFPGFSHTMIWKYETGRALPTARHLAQLAALFGVPPEMLLDSTHRESIIPATGWPRIFEVLQQRMAAQEWEEAYVAGQQALQQARQLGDPDFLEAIESQLTHIITQMPDQFIVEAALQATEFATLDRFLRYLKQQQHWTLWLRLNAWVIQRMGAKHPEYSRMIEQRLRVLERMGFFAEALEWVQCLRIEAPPITPLAQAHYTVTEGLMHIYQGHMDEIVDVPTALLQQSLRLWSRYWTARRAAVWATQAWREWPALYREALASSQAQWRPSPSLQLSGVQAGIDWAQHASSESLTHLRQMLRETPAKQQPGYPPVYATLYAEYLHLALVMAAPEASSEWACHVQRLQDTGRTGWVAYWMGYAPTTLTPDTLPIALSALA